MALTFRFLNMRIMKTVSDKYASDPAIAPAAIPTTWPELDDKELEEPTEPFVSSVDSEEVPAPPKQFNGTLGSINFASLAAVGSWFLYNLESGSKSKPCNLLICESGNHTTATEIL